MTLQAVRGQQVRAGTPAGTGTLDAQSTRANDAPHQELLLKGAHGANTQLPALGCGEFLDRGYSMRRQLSASKQWCAQCQQGHQRNHPGPRQTRGSSAPAHGPGEGCLASTARWAAVCAPHHTTPPVPPTRASKLPGRTLRKQSSGLTTSGGARLPHRAEDMLVAVASRT